jgi:hypothetical protein
VFDVIVVDFPDPTNFSLGKLYTTSFYQLLDRHLAAGGFAVVQTTSPLIARRSFWTVAATLEAVGLATTPYHAHVPSFGEWGFIVAGRRPFRAPTALPPGLRFLTPEGCRRCCSFRPTWRACRPSPTACRTSCWCTPSRRNGARCTNDAAPPGWLAARRLAAARPAAARDDARRCTGGWVGAATSAATACASPCRATPARALPRRAAVLVVGAGIAGLAAARGFHARRHRRRADAGAGRPARRQQPRPHDGWHGLPAGRALPAAAGRRTHEVIEWLHELGLLRQRARAAPWPTSATCATARRSGCSSTAPGTKACCRRPTLPPGAATLAQYRRFAARWPRRRPSPSPATAAWPWTAAHAALDAQTFALAGRAGPDRPRCAGTWTTAAATTTAPARQVSAWAGLHYFASRHGFHAPGDGDDGEREPVLTWPEGNAWLVQRLAAPLARPHARRPRGAARARATPRRAGAGLARRRLEAWTAGTVVLALPLFVAQLDKPLLDRPGVPQAWDSVVYGSRALGYVDAMHQSLRPHAGPTVLTAYHACPPAIAAHC